MVILDNNNYSIYIHGLTLNKKITKIKFDKALTTITWGLPLNGIPDN